MSDPIVPQTQKYRTERRRSTPLGMSYCTRCDNYKDWARFSKDENRRGGLKSICKDCDKLLRTAYYATTKDKSSARMRKRNLNHYYGICEDEYQAMFEAQGGKCAICGEIETGMTKGVLRQNLTVDHDHETGKIRGLLCMACNLALGGFKDRIENLANAIDYLMETHR